MKIRECNNDDCEEIYQLHISSINSCCSSHYDEQSLNSWISTKSPHAYMNLPKSIKMFVMETNMRLCGFGIIDIDKQSINGLYIHPDFVGKKIGKALLDHMENLAKLNKLDSLNLMSTLNAVSFYKKMGYAIEGYDIVKLSSGSTLNCVRMKKYFFAN